MPRPGVERRPPDKEPRDVGGEEPRVKRVIQKPYGIAARDGVVLALTSLALFVIVLRAITARPAPVEKDEIETVISSAATPQVLTGSLYPTHAPIWVDTDRDLSFADEKVMTDYAARIVSFGGAVNFRLPAAPSNH